MGRLLRPSWAIVAALLITAFGALLRLDAFTGKHGPLDHPDWARVMTHDVAPIARHLRPSTILWGREPRPYVGGDPITYLKFGREMTSFYQAHVREPVFLALTRFSLWALDNQDAGVSLASAIGSGAWRHGLTRSGDSQDAISATTLAATKNPRGTPT